MPTIAYSSVFVDDQEKALHFYTEVLGFELKHDVPLGGDRWLTVTRVPQFVGRRGARIWGLTWANGCVVTRRACVHARPEAG